jgi:hypothetical protein
MAEQQKAGRDVKPEARADEPKATAARKADDAAEPKDRRPRDNRKVLRGVQIPAGGNSTEMRTYHGETEEDLDALEESLTPEQAERLKESGDIEGDWKAKGKPAPPMRGSKAMRDAENQSRTQEGDLAALNDARTENEKLKAQLAKLEREAKDRQ